MEIKIGTFNAKGVGSKSKRLEVFHWIKENDFDICFIQEAHFTAVNKTEWEREWGGDTFFSGTFSNKEGIGILINPNLNYKIEQYTEIIIGRMQALNVCISDKVYTLINLYGPNENSYIFYQHLDAYIESTEPETLIIGGDFNTILDNDLDKNKKRGKATKAGF